MSWKIHGRARECVDIFPFPPWAPPKRSSCSHTERSGRLCAVPLRSNYINTPCDCRSFVIESLPQKRSEQFLFVFLLGSGEVKILQLFSAQSAWLSLLLCSWLVFSQEIPFSSKTEARKEPPTPKKQLRLVKWWSNMAPVWCDGGNFDHHKACPQRIASITKTWGSEWHIKKFKPSIKSCSRAIASCLVHDCRQGQQHVPLCIPAPYVIADASCVSALRKRQVASYTLKLYSMSR